MGMYAPEEANTRLRDWWSRRSVADLMIVVERAETSYSYLYQVCHSYRRPSPELADRIEFATGGELTSELLLSIRRWESAPA